MNLIGKGKIRKKVSYVTEMKRLNDYIESLYQRRELGLELVSTQSKLNRLHRTNSRQLKLNETFNVLLCEFSNLLKYPTTL